MRKLSGIITPLVTPFRNDGTIDCESLAHLIDFQIERVRLQEENFDVCDVYSPLAST